LSVVAPLAYAFQDVHVVCVHDERAVFLDQAAVLTGRAMPFRALLPRGMCVLFFEWRELRGELRRVALLSFAMERMPQVHSHFTFFRNK
jgi:hypothetical protein